MTNGNKIEIKILLHFDPMVRVLSCGVEDTPLQHFLLSRINSFDSIFSGIVWIGKLHNCALKYLFQCLRRKHEKDIFLLFMITVAKRGKMLHQSCTFELDSLD